MKFYPTSRFQDLQTIDLEPYQYSGVNFTGVRLIDPDFANVSSIVKMHEAEWGLDSPRQLRVEHALMYDAVQLFARAFKQLKDSIEGDVKRLPCNDTINWEHGYSLSNFMRVVSWIRIYIYIYSIEFNSRMGEGGSELIFNFYEYISD